MNSYTLCVSKIEILFVFEILRVISFPIPLWIQTKDALFRRRLVIGGKQDPIGLRTQNGTGFSLMFGTQVKFFNDFDRVTYKYLLL